MLSAMPPLPGCVEALEKTSVEAHGQACARAASTEAQGFGSEGKPAVFTHGRRALPFFCLDKPTTKTRSGHIHPPGFSGYTRLPEDRQEGQKRNLHEIEVMLRVELIYERGQKVCPADMHRYVSFQIVFKETDLSDKAEETHRNRTRSRALELRG